MKFTIQKGQPFQAIIRVKKQGSPDAAIITAAGPFWISVADPQTEPCLLVEVNMLVEDALNGKLKLVLTADDTAKLPTKTGFSEDGARALQTCKGVSQVTTEDAGLIYFNIPEIYVEDSGATCTM
jgi:hypothetical protein